MRVSQSVVLAVIVLSVTVLLSSMGGISVYVFMLAPLAYVDD